MNYDLSQHALTVLAARGIAREWLERAIERPEVTEPDPADPALERRYRSIPEHGNRVLRVVLNTTVVPARVVSVFFDRRMKGRL